MGTHRYRSYGNRPAVIIRSKKDKTCILIDVAMPADIMSRKRKQERK